MKYIITESQYNFLIEQKSDAAFDRSYGTADAASKTNSDNRVFANSAVEWLKNPHNVNNLLQIGTAFIPLIGPFISAGIGLADAAMYYKEGDTKTAGLMGVFAAIPGVGGLAGKLGLNKWGAKALGEIGKKISLGLKLTPAESQVASRVAQYRQLIQSEMTKIGESATLKGGAQSARKKLANKDAVQKLKGIGKKTAGFGAQTAGFEAVGHLYNKSYDKITGQEKIDFASIDQNKISQANKKAAAEIKFD
jgi:hypothetical protein